MPNKVVRAGKTAIQLVRKHLALHPSFTWDEARYYTGLENAAELSCALKQLGYVKSKEDRLYRRTIKTRQAAAERNANAGPWADAERAMEKQMGRELLELRRRQKMERDELTARYDAAVAQLRLLRDLDP